MSSTTNHDGHILCTMPQNFGLMAVAAKGSTLLMAALEP